MPSVARTLVDALGPQGTGGYFNLLTYYSDVAQAPGWFVHTESNACLAPERALGALALLGAEDYRAISSARLLNHVITRLADTISFAAMQGAQLTLSDRTLDMASTIGTSSTGRLVDALHLVLDKIQGLDATVAPEALREPDYRTNRPIAFWSFDFPDGEVTPGNGMGVSPIAYDLVGDRDLVFDGNTIAQDDDYGVHFSSSGSPETPILSPGYAVRAIPLPGDFTISLIAKRPPSPAPTRVYAIGSLHAHFRITPDQLTGTSEGSRVTVGWQTSTGTTTLPASTTT